MSHVATIDLEIKDLKSLVKAGERLGLEFIEEKKAYKWYGKHVGDYPVPEGFTKENLGKCDHVLRVKGSPNAYEIGIVKRGNQYKLLWDFWQGGYGLQDKVGENGGKLKQAYAIEVAKKQALREGYVVKERKAQDGSIILEATA